jgi:hypothetical protein
MSRNIFIAQTNAVEGREDEFNDWYTSQHVPDALQVPGFVAAQRFRLSATQRPGNSPYSFQYLTIYEMEGDLEVNLKALADAVPGMTISTSLATDRLFHVFEPLGDRVEAQ